jgi:hypothetical protein
MLAPTDERQNLFFDQCPVGHHLPIARTDHQVAASNQRPIASAVPFEVGVPLAAVKLEDEPIADQEVDATDPGDRDLCAHPQVAAPERESRERLDPGLRRAVVQFQQATAARRGQQQADDGVGMQDATIDDGVDHDDGRSEVEALHGKGERRERIVDPSRVVETFVRPVQPPVRSARHRDSGGDSHMDVGKRHRPGAVMSERRDTGESPASPDCRGDDRISAFVGVHAAPQTTEPSIGDAARDLSRRQSAIAKPPGGVDVHPATLAARAPASSGLARGRGLWTELFPGEDGIHGVQSPGVLSES